MVQLVVELETSAKEPKCQRNKTQLTDARLDVNFPAVLGERPPAVSRKAGLILRPNFSA